MVSNDDFVRKTYARLAPEYDRRWSFYIDASVRETVKRLEVRSGDRLLDVACGTGVLLGEIAERFPDVRLSGVDLSAEMLAMARNRIGAGADLQAAPADRLPYASESFDVVVSTNAFHYFRKPDEVVAEFARVLKPEGRVVISDWCDDYLACKLVDIALRWIDKAHFRTYGALELKSIIERAGLDGVCVDRYRLSWLWGMMTARGRRASIAATPR